jgi:hypothetical protein
VLGLRLNRHIMKAKGQQGYQPWAMYLRISGAALEPELWKTHLCGCTGDYELLFPAVSYPVAGECPL